MSTKFFYFKVFEKDIRFAVDSEKNFTYQAADTTSKAILRYICYTNAVRAALEVALQNDGFELLDISNDGIESQLVQVVILDVTIVAKYKIEF